MNGSQELKISEFAQNVKAHIGIESERLCTKCHELKLINQFYKRPNKPIGYSSWCIDCLKVYNKEYKQREHIAKRIKEWRKTPEAKEDARQRALKYSRKYKNKIRDRCKEKQKDWGDYFKQIYGDNPKCECCGARLNWGKGNGKYVVFDHQHGDGLVIKQQPSAFVSSHLFNDKNIAIWEKENFGIICQGCNSYLPTSSKDREQYVFNLVQYVLGDKTVELLTEYLRERI